MLAYDAAALWVAGLFMGGLWLSIPLTVFTSQPWLGAWMQRNGLLSLPEENQPPVFLKEVAREASAQTQAVPTGVSVESAQ